MGVTFLKILIGEKPIRGCAKNSLKSMVEFIGYSEFKRLYDKLRVETDEDIIKTMEQLKTEPGYLQDYLSDKDDGIPGQARSMLRKMLRVDPEYRISME